MKATTGETPSTARRAQEIREQEIEAMTDGPRWTPEREAEARRYWANYSPRSDQSDDVAVLIQALDAARKREGKLRTVAMRLAASAGDAMRWYDDAQHKIGDLDWVESLHLDVEAIYALLADADAEGSGAAAGQEQESSQ